MSEGHSLTLFITIVSHLLLSTVFIKTLYTGIVLTYVILERD
jgi:hypothetical protein